MPIPKSAISDIGYRTECFTDEDAITSPRTSSGTNRDMSSSRGGDFFGNPVFSIDEDSMMAQCLAISDKYGESVGRNADIGSKREWAVFYLG